MFGPRPINLDWIAESFRMELHAMIRNACKDKMTDLKFFAAEDFADGFSALASANRANRILAERATRVYGKSDGSIHNELHYPWTGELRPTDTHTALLIGVTKIRKDTAADIVRELAAQTPITEGSTFAQFVDRARRLIGEGREA